MEAHVPPPGAVRLAAQTKHVQTPEGLGDLEREMLRVSARLLPSTSFKKKKIFSHSPFQVFMVAGTGKGRLSGVTKAES